MPNPYVYSIADDLPGGAVNPTKLHAEIVASAIASQTLVGIHGSGDVLTLEFTGDLSAGDKTILDADTTGPAGGLLAGHDNTVDAPTLSVAHGEDLTEQTKGGTNFSEAFRLTFTPEVAGDYIIVWGFFLRTASNGKVADVEVELDDTTIIGWGSVSNADVANLRVAQSGITVLTLTATEHHIDVDYRLNPGTSGDTAKIENIAVSVFPA